MRRSALNFVLAIGFFAVAAGVWFARRAPATGYEASIYASTPAEVWGAFAVAFAVAIGTAVAARGRAQALGIGVGVAAVTAIVSLPALRGYRYLGKGDALTHLGWTRDVLEGAMAPHELFYPGLHGIASVAHLLGGISVERAILLTVILLFVPFLVFVPLVVRDLTGSAAAVGFAAVVSWFVLPINNIATHMGAHTNTNALFLVPVALFGLVAYLRRRSDAERLPFGVSPYGALVVAVGVGLLLVHPQQMFNVVIVFGAVSILQYLARRRYDGHPFAEHTTVHAYTGALGLVFAAWVASDPRFREAVAGLATGLLSRSVGGGAEVGQRGGSLAEIGGGLAELFAKLFLAAAIVGLIAGLFVLAVWFGRTRLDRESRSFVNYLSLSLIPLGGLFAVYFVGTPTMAFRQVGFIYVILTILAGIGLARWTGWLGGRITTPGAYALSTVLVAACLVLSLATVFASPFIYSPTQHVSDQEFSGYETALERGDGETPYAGYGFAITRYAHGIQGVEAADATGHTDGGEGLVSADAFEAGEYTSAYRSGGYYFVVTEWDETREIDVYRELNHGAAALEGLETRPVANKVVSNDDFRMYTVYGDE